MTRHGGLWTEPVDAPTHCWPVNVNVIEQEISSHASLTLLGWRGRERERERERDEEDLLGNRNLILRVRGVVILQSIWR